MIRRALLALVLAAASCRSGAQPAAPAGGTAPGVPGKSSPAPVPAVAAAGSSGVLGAPPLETTFAGEPLDAWSRDDGRPLPEVLWHQAPREVDEPALPPRCGALERRYGKKQAGVIDFGCALSPTGEAWAAVARFERGVPAGCFDQVMAETYPEP